MMMMKKQEGLEREMEERTARGESFAMIKAFIPPSLPPSLFLPQKSNIPSFRTSYYSLTSTPLPPSLPPSFPPSLLQGKTREDGG